MPLQIRRGTTAQRLSITPLPGELILDTDTNLVYVGDGSTPGGNILTSPPSLDTEVAITAAGNALVAGDHENIIFTYGPTQDAANRIDARVDLSNYTGEIQADAFRGSLYADDSSLVFNSTTNSITVSTLTASNIDADVVVSDIVGSIFSNNSSILVDANDASINLDGTVKGDIIPDQNEVYDIGSSSNRFKDIYLSGTSINLGLAQITSVGSAINLPVGSTVNGVPIGSGTGGGDGVIEGSSYKINIVSDSSTIMVNSDTEQLFGNLTGNVIGNVLGNITGNVTGDLLGFHLGDVKGSVFADDSSTIVDSINSVINADVGNFNNLATTFLDGVGSSEITVRTGITLQSDLTVDNEITVKNDIIAFGNIRVSKSIIGNSGTLYINNKTEIIERLAVINEKSDNISAFSLSKHTNTNLGARIVAERSRGTRSSPVAVVQNDILSVFSSVGYDGTDFLTGAAITTTVDSAVSTGIIPTNIVFSTRNSTGVLGDRGRFNSNGTFELFLPLFMTRTNISNDFMIAQQFHSSPNESANLTFTRARGTISAPTIASSNDAIIDLAAAAFDGVTYIGSSTIRMNIDGAVSSGIVPGRIEFWTANLSGSQTKKAQFNRDGILEVNQIRALNSNLSIRGDLIGSVFADSSTMIIDGTDGTVKYYPTTSSDWSAPAPTTVGEALDRLAAVVKILNAGVGA